MKTRYSADYYEKKEFEFLGHRDCINPYKRLDRLMSALDDMDITEDARKNVRHYHAVNIANECKAELLARKPLYKRLMNGDVGCLGMVQRQAIDEANRIITDWEFNCWLLSKFMKEYSD